MKKKITYKELFLSFVTIIVFLSIFQLAVSADNSSCEKYAGVYEGTFWGDDSGTWTLALFPDCEAYGFFYSSEDEDYFLVTATADPSGSFSGSADSGAEFQGAVSADGYVTGQWRNDEYGYTGSFSGQKDHCDEYAGVYEGTYWGDDSGTWVMAVDSRCLASGLFYSQGDQEYYQAVGAMNVDAEFLGVTESGSSFWGWVESDFSVSGEWENEDWDIDGSFSGSRISLLIEYRANRTDFTGGNDYVGNHLELAFTKPSGLSEPVDLYISLTQPSITQGEETFYFVHTDSRITLPNGIYFNNAVPVLDKRAYLVHVYMPDVLTLYGPSEPIFNDGWVIPAPNLCSDLPDGVYSFTVEAYRAGTDQLLAIGGVNVVLNRGCR